MGLALAEPEKDDVAVVVDQVRVYLQKVVAEWYEDAVLDFQQDEWGAGFIFDHPNLSSC